MEFAACMDCLASLVEATHAAGDNGRILYGWYGLLNEGVPLDKGTCPYKGTKSMLNKGDAATSAQPYVGSKPYQNTFLFTEYNITSVFEGYKPSDVIITGPVSGCMIAVTAVWGNEEMTKANQPPGVVEHPLSCIPEWQTAFNAIEKDLPITKAWLGHLSFVCESQVAQNSLSLPIRQRTCSQ
uniref:Uncharacterized protein n=1 Tax=Alexandrium monilatum TaxID=311494 RepID=A0A7S4VAD5_9DINO